MADYQLNEDWDDEDDKGYRGRLDRMNVSLTEEYEVSYFVDKYLKKRGATLNDNNRGVIRSVLKRCPLPAPIHRDKLAQWLDTQVSIG